MVLGSCARRGPCVNLLTDFTREQDELVSAQVLAKRSNAGSDETPTNALIPLEAPTLPLVSSFTEDFFIRFMKVIMETTQAQTLTEWQKRQLKARTSDTYFKKFYIDCYYFCQQCEDYFKISSATRMNHTPFAAIFLYDTVNLRWAQHKCRHKNATLITWPEFKTFLRKNLKDSQAFINSIWSKFRRDSQYQLEETRDYASHIQHLQSILVEYGTIGAPYKTTMICYF